MQVEYVVSRRGQAWFVRHGHTAAQVYDTRERALLAAENFAQAAARRGETAVVKLAAGEGLQEIRRLSPAGF
jgi:hypothetical protein